MLSLFSDTKPCENVDCGDHGLCVVTAGPEGDIDNLTYKCSCEAGYEGTKCDQRE